MTSDVLTATQLIAVLTIYCIVFCPILYWTIDGSMPFKRSLKSSTKRSHA